MVAGADAENAGEDDGKPSREGQKRLERIPARARVPRVDFGRLRSDLDAVARPFTDE